MSKNLVSAAIRNPANLPNIKFPLAPASGTGKYYERSAKSLRLVKRGCTNRPFYQVIATEVCLKNKIGLNNIIYTMN
jgi:hypothetical protein